MQVFRTPDTRFTDLADYPFEAHYADVTDGESPPLRMHFVDEGPSGAPIVLLLHGEPSWSYLYRKMIPPIVAAGYRCVAPDLVGFGRSDKPGAAADYSYARHVAWLRDLVINRLDLRSVTLFGQDWGGLLGLRVVAGEPDRFARVAISNTALPTGEEPVTEAFLSWQRFAAETDRFPAGKIISGACATPLSDATMAAYDAPFPDESFQAGARVFPALVPTRPDDPAHDDNVAAWQVLRTFDRPFLCLFSDGDPVTAGGDERFIEAVPGARSQPHRTLRGAGHFVQEDRPFELAERLLAFIAESR